MANGIERHFEFKLPKISPHVIKFTAREAVSTLFEVEMTCAHKDQIKFDEVIGKEALLFIPGIESERHVHGMISQFVQVGSSDNLYHYRATVVPMLWLLSLKQNSRIFQDMDVKEIVTKVLEEGGMTSDNFEFRLKGSYDKKEYCVQFGETDLNFISRLLEEEGIFYFFEHKENDQKQIQHYLIFGDSTVNYQLIAGGEKDSSKSDVAFHAADTRGHKEDTVQEIALCREIRPGKITLNDFNFQKPSVGLTVDETADSFDQLELYDYPGDYSAEDRGKTLAKIRLEEARLFMDRAEGRSDCPNFVPGFTFNLTGHELDSHNQEYLLIETVHTGTQAQTAEDGVTAGGFSYFNQFVCVPSAVPVRPVRSTPKPAMEGVQTAIVVGPSGEEIYTDEHGRIKVQFHWDREGKNDEKSSCWIRVSQTWAGTGWGGVVIPRIGQEVIVDFEQGDPDKPIVTGCVYNGTNVPPYELPDEKTKSTLMSLSSPDGGGFNEIRFEDAKGNEELYIHAQKDMNLGVENDRSETIGNDRNLTIGRDKLENVDRDTHKKIARDEIAEIGRDHNLKIGGKEAIEIAESHSFSVGGDVIEVFKKNHSEEVTSDYYVKAKNVVIEAMTGLTINVGGNFITIDSSGISIKGSMVNINSGGSALSGSPGSLVAPAAPLEAVISGESAAGKIPAAIEPPSKMAPKMGPVAAIAHNAPTHKEPAEEEAEEKSWVEIELVGEDDKPITGEKYIITLPDGQTVATGTTGSDGKARVKGIDAGNCKVTFPNLDKDAWEKV